MGVTRALDSMTGESVFVMYCDCGFFQGGIKSEKEVRDIQANHDCKRYDRGLMTL